MRNPVGYARCPEALDNSLAEWISFMGDEDLLMVTADHGNDPTFHGTDHTREKVPLLIYSPAFKKGKKLKENETFACIGATCLYNFGLEKKDSMLGKPLLELFE